MYAIVTKERLSPLLAAAPVNRAALLPAVGDPPKLPEETGGVALPLPASVVVGNDEAVPEFGLDTGELSVLLGFPRLKEGEGEGPGVLLANTALVDLDEITVLLEPVPGVVIADEAPAALVDGVALALGATVGTVRCISIAYVLNAAAAEPASKRAQLK